MLFYLSTMGNLSTASSSEQASSMQTLVDMGFTADQVAIALQASGNNLDAALDMLVEQRATEERLRRASAAESRILNRSFGTKPVATVPAVPRSVPAVQRSQPVAAVKPATRSVATAVQPGYLEALGKIADRPLAIDTLVYVLRTIKENPNEPKYRSIKVTNSRFKETFGAEARTQAVCEEILRKVGFEVAGEWLSLPPNFSRTNLDNSLEALNEIQRSSVYMATKRILEFEKVMEASRATADAEELERRAKYAAKLPLVPPEGAAGTTRVTVIINEGAPPLTRRFASDDNLLDVVHWIGSERSVVCSKLLDGDWILVDETMLQKKPLDFIGASGQKSLYALGLWPSATLHVRLRPS